MRSAVRRRLEGLLGTTVQGAAHARIVEEIPNELGVTISRAEYEDGEGGTIPALVLQPPESGPHAGLVVHHQHAGRWDLGKSEVAGLAGDPDQAFGLTLACAGFVVLAPDALAFEDRRPARSDGDEREPGWVGQLAELSRRLVRGDTLMGKLVSDSRTALTVLESLEGVDSGRVGIAGHSFGGTTSLFHMALDDRIRFGVVSGAACSYRSRISRGIGIEMASIIPGIVGRLEIDDLLVAAGDRPLLVVSGADDPLSHDAPELVETANRVLATEGRGPIEEARFAGGHGLDRMRTTRMVRWMVDAA